MLSYKFLHVICTQYIFVGWMMKAIIFSCFWKDTGSLKWLRFSTKSLGLFLENNFIGYMLRQLAPKYRFSQKYSVLFSVGYCDSTHPFLRARIDLRERMEGVSWDLGFLGSKMDHSFSQHLCSPCSFLSIFIMTHIDSLATEYVQTQTHPTCSHCCSNLLKALEELQNTLSYCGKETSSVQKVITSSPMGRCCPGKLSLTCSCLWMWRLFLWLVTWIKINCISYAK